MDEKEPNFPLFLHKTIKEESSFSSVFSVKDKEGATKAIFIAKGKKLSVFDVQKYSVNLEIDFNTPIIAISDFKIGGRTDSVLIILENFEWFILQTQKIIGRGSLNIPKAIVAKKFILPTSSYLNEGSFSGNFYTNNCVRFFENRKLIASNDFYCAVHLFSNMIHIFSIRDFEENKITYAPILFPIYLPNIIQMCFLDSDSSSQVSRLAILSDGERKLTEERDMNPNKLKRMLLILEINQNTNEIKREKSIELTSDCHHILPLIYNGNTVIIGFTFSGIIKIIANTDSPPTTECISCNVDSITLFSQHYIDDLYFLYGGSGVVQMARFSHNSPPNIEILFETPNIISSINKIDQNHILLFEAYNDMILYQVNVTHKGMKFKELQRKKEIGHISQLISTPQINPTNDSMYGNSYLCLTGNGKQQELQKIYFVNSCTEIMQINVSGCIDVFSSSLSFNDKSKIECIGESILLCFSFLNSSKLVLISDGKIIDFNSLSDFLYDSRTLYFGLISRNVEKETCFIQITDKKILLLFIDKSKDTKYIDFNDNEITHVSVFNETFCIRTSSGEFALFVIENQNLKNIQKWTIPNDYSNCIFLSHNEHFCSLLCSDFHLYIFSFNGEEQLQKQLFFDLYDLPSSMQITSSSSSDKDEGSYSGYHIYIGTNSGNISVFDEELNLTKTHQISEANQLPIKMIKNNSKILFFSKQFCGTINENNEYNLIDINANDIISLSAADQFLCILQHNICSIYKQEKINICKLIPIQKYQNAYKVLFSVQEKKAFVLMKDSKRNFSISLYENYTNLVVHKEITMQFSLFTFLEQISHNSKDIQEGELINTVIDPYSSFLIIGTSDNYIYLYDTNFTKLATTKTQNIATCAQLIHNKIFIGEGRNLSVYDLNLNQIQCIKPSFTTLISSINTISDGSILVLGDNFHSIQLFSLDDGAVCQNICNDNEEKGISHMVTVGDLIFASTYDASIVIFLFTENECLYELCHFHTNSKITSLFRNHDEMSIFYTTEDGGIYKLSIIEDSMSEKIANISNFLDEQNLENYKRYDTKLLIDCENLKQILYLNEDKARILTQNGFQTLDEFEKFLLQ